MAEKALPAHLGGTWHPEDDGSQYTEEESRFLKECERERARLKVKFLRAVDYLRVAKKVLGKGGAC